MRGYDPNECYVPGWAITLHWYRRAQAPPRWRFWWRR